MKVRDLVLHNFRLKLISLLVAVLLWTTIHLATRPGSALHQPFLTTTNQIVR